MHTAGNFIDTCDQDATFLQTICTGNESWCYQYDPVQTLEWCSPASPCPKKTRLQKSRIKTILVLFFDSNGMIHQEFVQEGQTVNAKFYESTIVQKWKVEYVA
ncbi:hypothetical protein AVEN_35687-1 [Araneus ventricosus]|uniref:Uncharacterized protein n=1 Tax=Araneus ventricosus TaxID=182803 RepID=A0A4Y2WMM6_ARAVE|nr:hypothetical protein AVEN_262503-1 [Araneus ventricosus]GBO37219.1 hypothetical protein AVEN_153527-1 [Araneus ventricosus]GBO37220.1 hypothetical protein AVEN_192987-1 [Araneus ventricosus]GBO37248.1 hypothetical protein AVEN_35687-1 [Araneus ventricosus]